MSMCSLYNQNQYSFTISEQTKEIASREILRIIPGIYETETRMCIFIKLFPKSLKSHQVFAQTSQSTNETNKKCKWKCTCKSQK